MYRINLVLMLAAFLCILGSISIEAYGADNAKRIAAVTCAVIKETRNMDSAIRVEKMNAAREKLGLPPFLDGDAEIVRSVRWGTCELLVLNSPHYESTTQKNISIYRERKRIEDEKEAEANRIAAKKKAEANRIAAQKKADADKKAEEKLNKVLAAWEEAARKEISKWIIIKDELVVYTKDSYGSTGRFSYRFLVRGNLEFGMILFGDVIVEFNDHTLPKLKKSNDSYTTRSAAIRIPSCLEGPCTSSVLLDKPNITRELRKKFLETFGSNEVENSSINEVYVPNDSYKAQFVIKGIYWHKEPYDFIMEFYPELKNSSPLSTSRSHKFINPIIINIQ